MMTLKMTSTQVVQTSVTTNKSHCQDYTNPDDQPVTNTDSPGFRPFTVLTSSVRCYFSVKYLKKYVKKTPLISTAIVNEAVIFFPCYLNRATGIARKLENPVPYCSHDGT